MLPLFKILLCLAISLLSVSSAKKTLPRALHADPPSPALVELHEVMISPRSGLYIPGAIPHPRSFHPANEARKRDTTTSPFAKNLRTLLTRQQTCDPGYAFCAVSGRCCPSASGKGQCCDDGTCVTNSSTCCTNGGACPSGQDCCLQGCKPTANTCCTDDWNCDPGLKCCGDRNCAPEGGECCPGRSSCEKGLHCVVLNGIQGCCVDTKCTEFAGSGVNNPASFSIPSFTFTTPNLPSVTPPPAPGALTITHEASYTYYTTTLTFYYYSYFFTTLAASSTPTSSRVTTTTTISVYASASSDAASRFSSLSADVASLTQDVTAPGFTGATAGPIAKGASSGVGRMGAGAIWGGWGWVLSLAGAGVGVAMVWS